LTANHTIAFERGISASLWKLFDNKLIINALRKLEANRYCNKRERLGWSNSCYSCGRDR